MSLLVTFVCGSRAPCSSSTSRPRRNCSRSTFRPVDAEFATNPLGRGDTYPLFFGFDGCVLPDCCDFHTFSFRISNRRQPRKRSYGSKNKAGIGLTVDNPPRRVNCGNGVVRRSSLLSLFTPVKSLAVICYTSGAGIGPKNIRRAFSFPITRTSSCTVQYITINTKRIIWMAQKCGQMISASNF